MQLVVSTPQVILRKGSLREADQSSTAGPEVANMSSEENDVISYPRGLMDAYRERSCPSAWKRSTRQSPLFVTVVMGNIETWLTCAMVIHAGEEVGPDNCEFRLFDVIVFCCFHACLILAEGRAR